MIACEGAPGRFNGNSVLPLTPLNSGRLEQVLRLPRGFLSGLSGAYGGISLRYLKGMILQKLRTGNYSYPMVSLD